MQKNNQTGKKNIFVSLIEKLYSTDEALVIRVIKQLLFVLLLFVEVLILIQQFSNSLDKESLSGFFMACVLVVIFTIVEGLNLFQIKTKQLKIIFYILDFLSVFALTIMAGNSYLTPLCIIILTDVYLYALKVLPSAISCVLAMVLYTLVFWAASWVHNIHISVLSCLLQSFSGFLIIVVHFVIFNFAMGFYRQNQKLKTALKKLDESKEQLQKAYDDLEEVSAMRERQRIAKEIHDTAGHSITTVIMQTEAAKGFIAKEPEEAKLRIISANLQAKHALEELRQSVHLLSGTNSEIPLKSVLERIIQESMDGTDIRIRFKIEDVSLPKRTERFLANTLKEGISNGIRHGKATAFWVELVVEHSKVKFLLSDNGCGVEKGKIKRGYGLTSMEDMVKELEGRIKFYANEGEGFEIKIELPFSCEVK